MKLIEVRNKLVQMRNEKDISQEDIADKLGVGQNTISLLENRKTIGWNALEKYAKALGVELEVYINCKN